MLLLARALKAAVRARRQRRTPRSIQCFLGLRPLLTQALGALARTLRCVDTGADLTRAQSSAFATPSAIILQAHGAIMSSSDVPPPELWAHFRALYGQMHEQSSSLSDELAASKRRNQRAEAALAELGVSSEQFEVFITTGVLGAAVGKPLIGASSRKEFSPVMVRGAPGFSEFTGALRRHVPSRIFWSRYAVKQECWCCVQSAHGDA